MTNVRRWVLLALYATSMLLSMLLIYLSAIHCQFVFVHGCTSLERQNQFTQIVTGISACAIIICSMAWWWANYQRVDNSCLKDYNFLEMPSAVFCSLLAGISCVIEIHYNFDYADIEWTRKWTMVAFDSAVLVFLHAGLAFALT